MNTISIMSQNEKQKLKPTDILKQLSQSQADGCLQITEGSVTYLIYVERGKLTYATHSIDPFERLERHLRRLSHENIKLTSAVRTQARLNFETASAQDAIANCRDYQAISWLVENKYLTEAEAKKLIELLAEEVFESYLLLSDFNYEVLINPEVNWLFHLDLPLIVSKSQQTLKIWQALAPQISSPYQRPYIAKAEALPAIQQKLSKVLIGFSFRQLAVLLNQNDGRLAQTLHPLIVKGIIKLREPQSPFEQLPQITHDKNLLQQQEINKWEAQIEDIGKGNIATTTTKAKIACVDDSPTMLKEINRFLDGHNLEVFTINDSVKALIEIMRIKPDLILLDVGMPTVDGYKLCRMIRNSSMFKNTPIVMVTGNTGLVDRAKAKVAGATDYMTKPFTQSDLLKIVFRYLT